MSFRASSAAQFLTALSHISICMGGAHCNPLAKPLLVTFEAHGGLCVIFIVGIQSGCACFEGVGCPLVTRRSMLAWSIQHQAGCRRVRAVERLSCVPV